MVLILKISSDFKIFFKNHSLRFRIPEHFKNSVKFLIIFAKHFSKIFQIPGISKNPTQHFVRILKSLRDSKHF